jgi:hypothetical protein
MAVPSTTLEPPDTVAQRPALKLPVVTDLTVHINLITTKAWSEGYPSIRQTLVYYYRNSFTLLTVSLAEAVRIATEEGWGNRLLTRSVSPLTQALTFSFAANARCRNLPDALGSGRHLHGA